MPPGCAGSGGLNAPANDSLYWGEYYRQQVYKQAYKMLSGVITDTTTRRYAAASFTANLWYQSDPYTTGQPWPITPAGAGFTAFAEVTDTRMVHIYLTEAYYKNDGTNKVNALELRAFNGVSAPYWNRYWIQLGNTAPVQLSSIFAANPWGAAGAWAVLLNVAAGTTTITGTQWNSLDLTNANAANTPIMTLEMMPVGNDSAFIPLDQMDYTALTTAINAANPSVTNPFQGDLAKDDTATDCRYSVAAAMKLDTTSGTNTLGAANTNVAWTDVNGATMAPYPVPAPRLVLTGMNAATANFTSLGMLNEIYLCADQHATDQRDQSHMHTLFRGDQRAPLHSGLPDRRPDPREAQFPLARPAAKRWMDQQRHQRDCRLLAGCAVGLPGRRILRPRSHRSDADR